MKKFALFLVVALTCAVFAPVANAQAGPLSLGGVFQLDQKRLEPAVGVTFTMAAYTAEPPDKGFDDPDLIGFFTTSLGQYPVLVQGTWVKVCVFPSGFDRLEGMDYDPTGEARANDGKDSSWQAMRVEDGGGFSIAIQLNRLGAYPLRFRIRHRDGRDKYQLLFFTATWIRGGDLPTALELMVQRSPESFSAAKADDVFPYLRGFISATATPQGQAQTVVPAAQVALPAQTASKTITNGHSESQMSGLNHPADQTGGAIPPPPPHDQSHDWSNDDVRKPAPVKRCSVSLGTAQEKYDGLVNLLGSHLSQLEQDMLDDAEGNLQLSSVTTVDLNPDDFQQIVLTFDDRRPFTACLNVDGRRIPLVVRHLDNGFHCVSWGHIHNFLSKSVSVTLTDDDGVTRTITFAKEDR